MKPGREHPDLQPVRHGRDVRRLRSELTRVFVVDDHDLFRTGLCGLLRQRGLEVVGDAADGESACEEIPLVDPHVVVMDLDLPGISGVEATRRLARSAPEARVIAFTMVSDEPSVTRAIAAGASGYLLKDATIEDMVAAVRAAAAGDAPISPRAAGSIFNRLRAEAESLEQGAGTGFELTEREREVLKLMVAGKSNGEIARELYISAPTVKHHISSILGKLGVENRIQAAVRAVRDRLVP